MSGAIPPLTQYSFIAWCSVTLQGQLYLYYLPVRLTCSDNLIALGLIIVIISGEQYKL
jgi:hypothetical protein